MTTLTEMELPYLPMDEAAFAADPFPFLDEARRQHPWLARCAFGYAVHGHGAIRDLLWLDDQLEPSFDDVVELMGAGGTEWGRFQHTQLLNLSGEDHRRLRDIVAPMFTPAAANRNRDVMRKTMLSVLDTWAPRGTFDFEEFVSYFPVTVMCALIGADPAVIPRLRSSLEALGLAFGMNRDFMPRVEQAHLVMDEFVHSLVAERRASPHAGKERRDLLDTLLAVTGEGGLTERELHDLLIFLFVAGYDTSKNVLTFIMNILLERPEDYARCAVDLDFCRKVSEETLRLHSPATITRRVGKDIDYRGVTFPKGTLLFFTVNVSGRDPNTFERADEFLPERELQERHTAFGRGVHICLGQFIARAQIEEGLHLLAQRLRNPRRTGEPGHRPFFGVWGLKGLPIAFDDAGAPTSATVGT